MLYPSNANFFLLFLALNILSACGPAAEKSAPSAENWISLFNGQDLTGWTPKIAGYELGENFANTFRVENGVLKVAYDEYPGDTFGVRFGHIFYEKPYSHYRLRLEYRFVGEQVKDGPGWAFRNNGIMFHCQSPESMAKDQDFPVSLEFQLLAGNGTDPRSTGNLCTPGVNVVMDGELITNHCISSSSKTYHGDQWVKAEVVVYGDSLIYHLIEGDTVLTYSKPQVGGGNVNVDYPLPAGTPVREGYISLQSETHPTEFRSIELLDLSGK